MFILLLFPQSSDSMARTFNQAHMRYSQYFNRKMGQRGHLWQGRFYSYPLDEAHLYTAVRYVERNPVWAGLVERGEDYPWSSALSRIRRINNPILSNDLPLLKKYQIGSGIFSIGEEEMILKQIRRCITTGRPAGSEFFVMRLEELLGRALKPKPIGRHRKNK